MRKSTALNEENINLIIELNKKGVKHQLIAEKFNIHISTVHLKLREYKKANGSVKKSKYTMICEELNKGTPEEQIIRIVGTTQIYIKQVKTFEENRIYALEKENHKKEKELKQNANKLQKIRDRKLEIIAINKEIERQKNIREKEWQKQLKIEQQELAKRFKGIVK